MNKQSIAWEMMLSENLVGKRFSKKELEENVSILVKEKVKFEETTNKDNIDLDYELLCGIKTCDNYYFINIYYLRTRNRSLYITEVSVDNE